MRDAQRIDTKLLELAARKGELDAEIGHWLVEAERAGVHRELGFASLVEYAERRLGFDARTTRERLRVAKALERLPRVRELLRTGARSWSAVREIVRVASPEHEAEWIDATEAMTVRQIESRVAGHEYGDAPSDPKDPVHTARRLMFELAPEAFAVVNDALEAMRAEIGPAATNTEALQAMAETVLGKRRGEEQPGYQVSVTICPSCDRTWQHTGTETIEVPDAVGGCAKCDGELVGATRIEHEAAHVGPEEGPVPMPKSTVDALMQAAASVFSGPRTSLTPLVRKVVRARDKGRCAVPGCRNHRFIDLHHLEPRARGGSHDPSNIVSLCAAHHALFHDGRLAIDGTPETGLRFTHANGVLYGAPMIAAGPSSLAAAGDRSHSSGPRAPAAV